MKGRCVGCGRRGVHRHHAVYEQHIDREGGNARDQRVLVWVCRSCHDAHHARTAPLPVRVLPDGVFEFAAELLGGPAAYEYIVRRYRGRDARLEALLEEERDD